MAAVPSRVWVRFEQDLFTDDHEPNLRLKQMSTSHVFYSIYFTRLPLILITVLFMSIFTPINPPVMSLWLILCGNNPIRVQLILLLVVSVLSGAPYHLLSNLNGEFSVCGLPGKSYLALLIVPFLIATWACRSLLLFRLMMFWKETMVSNLLNTSGRRHYLEYSWYISSKSMCG